jgi:hypothetical protein
VPLLVPTAADMYERFLLAEAQFDMLQILCAAAAYRADKGLWPATIDEISLHARRTMPQDPFSGDKFYYRIERGMPVVITRVPKKMLSQKRYTYLMALHHRTRVDEENTMNAAKGIREQMTREMNAPVPMQ